MISAQQTASCVPVAAFTPPVTSDFSTQAPSSTERACLGTQKSVLQLDTKEAAVRKPSPSSEGKRETISLPAALPALQVDALLSNRSGTGKKYLHAGGGVTPAEQGGSRLSPAESEDRSHQAGDAPRESRWLSWACVWLYVCRAAAQGAGLWPVEPLTLVSIGGCFVLHLCSMSRHCSASSRLLWLGGRCIVLHENKPQLWQCLNLLMLL